MMHDAPVSCESSAEEAVAQPSFISYARQEFYFAESLALHLQKAGMTTWFDVQRLHCAADWVEGIRQGLETCASLVLIASRASLASAHVTHEWQAVLAAGKPVRVAVVENVQLPAALEHPAVAILDFRGNFTQALDTLLCCMHTNTVHRDPVPRLRALPLPGRRERDVVLLSLGLLPLPLFLLGFEVAFIRQGLTSLPTKTGVDLDNTRALLTMAGPWIALTACGGLYRWWTFIQRRFRYQAVRDTSFRMLMVLMLITMFVLRVANTPSWRSSVAVTALVVLAVLSAYNGWTMMRSSAVLRWCPTGEAPQSLRRRHIQAMFAPAPAPATASASMKRYQLHYCPADRVIAMQVTSAMYKLFRPAAASSFLTQWWQALRTHFMPGRGQGVRASAGPASAVTPPRPLHIPPAVNETLHIVILSNKTPRALLDSVLVRYGTAVALVASSLQLPSDMATLTRYQWVDYRKQSEEQAAMLGLYLQDVALGSTSYSLSVVPESLAKFVVPRPVAFATWFLQSMAFGYIFSGLSLLLTFGVHLHFTTGHGWEGFNPLGPCALFAAGLIQFWAVGMALGRQLTRKTLGTVLVASLLLPEVIVATGGQTLVTHSLSDLLQLGALLFACGWWCVRVYANWLPIPAPEEFAGPTLALPPRKIWMRHCLVVASLVCLALTPFISLTIAIYLGFIAPPGAK